MDRTLQILIFFIILAAVFPALLDPYIVIGEGVDLYGTFWFYWWTSISIGGELDTTQLLFYPYGKDVFSHTGSNVVDAVLSIPFQKAFGIPNYQPYFILFILQINAICFEQYARVWSTERIKIACGTVVFTFMPYFCWELAGGRITQVLVFPALIALYYFEQLLRKGGLKYAVASGLMTALQGWVYWFYGYFLGFFLIWRVIVSPQFKSRWKELLVAFLTCVLSVFPAVWKMYIKYDQGAVPGLEPTFINNVHPMLSGYVLWEPGNVPVFSFISVSLLFICAVWGQHKKVWLGWLIISLLVATGPASLWEDESIQMPHYTLLQEIPFFSRLWFPYRILSCLSVALMLGVVLSKVHSTVMVLLTVFYFVEISSWGLFPFHTSPLDNGQIYIDLDQQGALFEIPLGVVKPSHYHQIYHNRAISGGMGENLQILWGKDYEIAFKERFTYFRKLSHVPEPVAPKEHLLDDFEYLTLDKRVSKTLFHSRHDQYLTNLCLVFGQPEQFDENIVIWKLSEYIKSKDCTVQNWRNTPIVQPSSWEMLLRARGRIP